MMITPLTTRKLIICLAIGVSVFIVTEPDPSYADAPVNAQAKTPAKDDATSKVNATASKAADDYADRLLASIEQNQAVPHRNFSLRACFDRADIDNKQIAVATTGLTAAQAGVVIARAIPNPTFSMAYGFGSAWRLIVAGNGQQFGWTEEIQVAGRRTKKTAVASANYVQTALQIETTRFGVHNSVRRAYAELAAAHAYSDLVEAQRIVATKLLDISQKRFDAGKAPGSEVLQANLGVMQFDTQRTQAWGRLVQDTAAMAMLLGEAPRNQEIIDVDTNGLFRLSAEKSVLVPSPDSETPSLEQLLPVAWRERKDLMVAVQTAYANKKSLILAKTQRIPDPTVGFQYFFSTYAPYQFGFFDPANVLPYLQAVYPNVPQLQTSIRNPNPPSGLVRSLYNHSLVTGAGAASGLAIPNIGQDKVPFQPGYQLTVGQEMPLFYQYQGQIAQAKATWVQQLKQNEQLRAQIATDVVTAYERLVVTRANIKKFQLQILPAAAKVAQMTRRAYQLGKVDLATVMLAQQQYQQLLSNYFDAVVAYQNVWADLEQTVGLPLNLQ
jgi:cobalt-zinc-cadmium efflux system outer membrane protein